MHNEPGPKMGMDRQWRIFLWNSIVYYHKQLLTLLVIQIIKNDQSQADEKRFNVLIDLKKAYHWNLAMQRTSRFKYFPSPTAR